MWWNLLGMVFNAGLGYATVYIIQTHPNECAGIKLASWALFSLYCVTFFLQLLCLCGLEIKYCSSMGLLAILVYDLVMITWAQVTHFQSQTTNCIDTVPVLYFWLMGQILFFYVVLALIIFVFFRKYC